MREAKHTAAKGSSVCLSSTTAGIFKESHEGKTIKCFMTTDSHLKSFPWFHVNYQNLPGIPHQCTTSISQLSCTLKMSLKKIQDPVWDLINGVTALSFTLKSEVVLSLSRGAPGQSLQSHSHLCAGPKKTTTGTQCFPGITNVFISTAVPSSTNLTRFLPTNGRVSLCAISNSYLKIIHFLKKRFPVCSRGHKDSTQRIKSFSKPTVLGEN